jgi:hypothetical protein
MSGNISLAGFVGRVLLVEQEAMARANRHLQPIGYLYPNLSQYAANRGQTVQSEPNGVFSFRITSEPERNHPFANPF